MDEDGAVEGGQQKRIASNKIQIGPVLKYLRIIPIIHLLFVILIKSNNILDCFVICTFVLTVEISKD